MPLQALAAWLSRLGEWREPAADTGVYAGELPAQELERIRSTAELSAHWLCRGVIAFVANPWRRGTRQWVLWETSYQAQVLQHEFANTRPGAAEAIETACEPEPESTPA